MTGYDIIGDIHANAEGLQHLLAELGYRHRSIVRPAAGASNGGHNAFRANFANASAVARVNVALRIDRDTGQPREPRRFTLPVRPSPRTKSASERTNRELLRSSGSNRAANGGE